MNALWHLSKPYLKWCIWCGFPEFQLDPNIFLLFSSRFCIFVSWNNDFPCYFESRTMKLYGPFMSCSGFKRKLVVHMGTYSLLHGISSLLLRIRARRKSNLGENQATEFSCREHSLVSSHSFDPLPHTYAKCSIGSSFLSSLSQSPSLVPPDQPFLPIAITRYQVSF